MKYDVGGLLPLEPRVANTLDSFITKIRADTDDIRSQSGRSWITDDDMSTQSGYTMTKRIYWPDGTLFEGFLNAFGRPEGRGELRAANGDRYVGDWKDGLLHGFGKYELGRGGVYEGQIIDNRRNGYGRLVCADGRMYEGQWKDDKPHGGGRFSHTAEGISYRGEWSNGRAHGRGTYEGKMWGRYTGQWAEDRKEGLGRVEFAGGNSYEGNWVNDMAHGWGRYQWANGDMYEGYFTEDKLDGEGRMVSVESGCVFTGQWKNNKKSGSGQIHYGDGAVFTGEWFNDMPEGMGTFFNPNGIMFRGVWRQGVFESAENPRGLPVCLVEGSSYQLQEDLRAQTGPHQLIDTRVVVPVPAAGDALAAAKMPRPRKFDENDSLADYLVEESSRFTSSVQPGGNQVAHKAGYVYHSRFNIEYWPHSGQRSTDEANMPTHRQRETLETHREKPVYTNEFVDTSVPPQTLKTQPEFTVPEFTDMGQAQHSAATTVPNNITSSAEQIVEVHRNVPVPVEAIITQELVLPKVRVNKTRVDYPVYCPRFVEVPVMVENLNEDGLQICREIEQQVALLEGAIAESRAMSSCELEQLATNLGTCAERMEHTVRPAEFPIDALYSQPYQTVP